jgi:hypothetical protein
VTAPGVVAATAGGRLTALDGHIGRPRWHYRLLGTEVQGLAASPDGTTVLAVFARRDITSPDEPQRLVVLDAVTGAPRWQQRLGTGGIFRSDLWNVSPTDHVLPVLGRPRGLIVGYDLASGSRRWTWTSPPNCQRFTVRDLAGGADTVVAAAECAAGDQQTSTMQLTLFGLDERSGVLRWRQVVATGHAGIARVSPVVSSDGQRVTLSGTRYLLDERTGRPVASLQAAAEDLVPDVGSLPVVIAELWDSATASTIRVVQPDGRRIPIDVRLPQYRLWAGGFFGWRFAGRINDRGDVGPQTRLYGVATTDRTLLVACLDTHGAPAVAVHDLLTPTATLRVIPLSGTWTPIDVESEAIEVLPAPGAVVLARLSPDPGQTAQPVIGLT